MPVFGPADDEKSSGGSAGRASPVSLFAIPAPVLLPILFRGLLFGLLRVVALAILSGGGLPLTRVVSRHKAKFSSCCASEIFLRRQALRREPIVSPVRRHALFRESCGALPARRRRSPVPTFPFDRASEHAPCSRLPGTRQVRAGSRARPRRRESGRGGRAD